MIDLSELIRSAESLKASDIHLTVGKPPVFRVHGVPESQGEDILTPEDTLEAAKLLATEEQLKVLEEFGESDFATTFEGLVRLRCNIFYQRECVSLALRLLPTKIPSADELKLPQVIRDLAKKPRGLILVTGPTGSGKSSTLAALIDSINHNSKRHIITLEAPIEYVHHADNCIINQREIGVDTKSFASGLRAALRQDPDVILVGEMRDLETISTAITAAETGHLVFGTLHTKGAVGTIDRIIDSFPPDQQNQVRTQLAEVLECAVGQTLLPCTKGGRRAVFEIMIATPAIRSLILQNKTFQIASSIQTGKSLGMQLLDDALVDLVRAKEITLEAAMTAANKPEQIQAKVRGF